MKEVSSRWGDLAPRLLSGGIMVLAGVLSIHFGGGWFLTLIVIATGVMCWELTMMNAPRSRWRALPAGFLAAGLLLAGLRVGAGWTTLLLFAPIAAIAGSMPRDRMIYGAVFSVLVLAGYGLVAFRDVQGGAWLFWLVLVVIVTDVFGYFAGRLIGGPKLWPAISPKKTWAGVVAGWLGAAGVGAVFHSLAYADYDVIWISVVLSFASQMGDIAESALKRRWGVKDSSNLIPGHGGLFDRFDGLLGAALFMLMAMVIVGVPQVSF